MYEKTETRTAGVFAYYFKIGNYEQRIETDGKHIFKVNCSCIGYSWFLQTKKNKGKTCKHIKMAIKILKENGEII